MIPIFIIVHDRLECLKKSVKSFEEQIKTPIEIIFHDVASSYVPCLEYLEEMRGKGYKVYRSIVNDHHSVLNTVKSYLAQHPECEYYVVTDPDIELDAVNGDILEYYQFLIEKWGKNYVAGPILRIDDIPDYYPKKDLVLDINLNWSKGSWRMPRETIIWKGHQYKVTPVAIDTTFHLAHRSNLERFPRKLALRCHAPYSARHLDWYIDPNNMSPDEKYYSENASKTAHWGKLDNKKPLKKPTVRTRAIGVVRTKPAPVRPKPQQGTKPETVRPKPQQSAAKVVSQKHQRRVNC